MKLTPLDIQQQRFRSVFWGYDPKEVDAFLDVVANELEELIRGNNGLRDELQRREVELQQHRERERNLKETMMTATRITEDIKQNARKEAEIVIAQAENQAEQIIQNAHTRLARVIEELDELKRQKSQFEETLRSVIQTHAKLLDSMTERESVGGEMLSLLNRRTRKNRSRNRDREDSDPEVRAGRGPGDELLDPRGQKNG
jgi:cell division initiation protein